MEISGAGKPPNTSLSFRYNANNEEIEELFDACEDDPPTPQFDASPSVRSENASPKRGDKTPSILDKYFKSIRAEKVIEKLEDVKAIESKVSNEGRTPPKDVSSSPMKEYLNRLGKRNTPDPPEVKEVKEVKEGASTNETWKIFHDFKFKIAQAVEDMKTRSLEESKEKAVPRDNSISDSEENSAIKDLDHSVGDTDNQVSSLDSSIQNLSEITQPLTAKPTECESSLPLDSKNHSESSDDTHKNLVHSDLADIKKDVLHSNTLEVESGVEALEDGIDGFGDVSQIESNVPSNIPTQNVPIQNVPIQVMRINEDNFNLPPSQSNLQSSEKTKSSFFDFTMYFITLLLIINFILFPNCNIWNGFLLGIWFFYIAISIKQYLLNNYFSEFPEPFKASFLQLKRGSSMTPIYTIPSVKEHRPIKKYEGWINHYRYQEYDPITYHINKTTTAFMKLEGTNLRISYTKKKIAKRALWDEKIEKVAFYQHRLYNLTGARIILLPHGIVRRRQWSKKYPICIILNEKENIQIFEKEIAGADKRASSVCTTEKLREHSLEMESAETNTSPEKRKKFIWRRREKSIPHTEAEVGKEGLRHRLVRKMHRGPSPALPTTDKKPDCPASCAETTESRCHDKNQQIEEVPFHDAEMEFTSKSVTSTKEDADEELDETELSRIKEFLDDAELDGDPESPTDGEWSLHVKNSKDKHSTLFLFARTGRDKHEWYRQIMMAISSAKQATSTDSSAAEERTGSENTPEDKEGIEMAIYKLSEKETVGFAKGTSRQESLSDGVAIKTPGSAGLNTLESYETTFWPYLQKIIETHEKMYKATSDIGVMCQIEPSPRSQTKSKKKNKDKDQKSPLPPCNCRMLPAEVSWVNTVLARIVYDVTRDPVISARLRNRIQRKLHTLKLPAFMSPLVVTELSLAGACPLVERVSAPSWDERGVWLDADLRYDGGAYITILTQINLMKLKEKNVTLEEQMLTTAVPSEVMMEHISDTGSKVHFSDKMTASKQAVYDSEVEDSAESSSDEDTPLVQPVDSVENLLPPEPTKSSSTQEDSHSFSSKKKFLRMVDKIATNKYFQQVTDYKYVKRAMEGLSNTDIKLQVEVHGLEGRLALNLPPPPHDRIWIGFRTNPQLVLKARPAVGARSVRFGHISNWIEEKLSKEFEKVLVLPNMEDILVELMTPTPTDFE